MNHLCFVLSGFFLLSGLVSSASSFSQSLLDNSNTATPTRLPKSNVPIASTTPLKLQPSGTPLATLVPTIAMPPSKGVALELKRVRFLTSALEISGAAMVAGKLRMVSDNKDDSFVYEVREQADGRMKAVEGLNFRKLVGYKIYLKHLPNDKNNKLKVNRQDFEGLAACGTTMYVIDERVRNVLKFRTDGGFERLQLTFAAVKGVYEGGENAGFEGVAVDCEKKIMYLAKERQPRFLLKIDMKKWKILEQTDVIDPTVAKPLVRGVLDFGSVLDFSDLVFDRGFLFALSRNERDLLKIDPNTFKVVDRRSYAIAENGLYKTGEPFGIAEALVLTSEEIIVGLDNNQSPLTEGAMKKYGVSGNVGSFLYFKRPMGF